MANKPAFAVTNIRAFGKLIKMWSKGEAPVPADLDAFIQALTDNKVGPKVDRTRIKKVKFVKHDADTIFIRLPPKSMLEAHEARLATQDYTLPKFYGTVTAPGAQVGATKAAKLKFDDERIGDYTISNCA